MKVFVTGGSGFLGSYVCRELSAAGHDVAVLSQAASPWRLRPVLTSIKILTGDIGAPASWQDELMRFGPDAVAHLAWRGVANSERDAPSQALNIAWTARLVVSARAAGAQVFLGVGSQAEYGPKSAAIGPGDTTLPTSLYGTCKLAAGRLAGELATQCGIRFVWLRLLSAYGPTDHPYWMIPGLIGTLLNGGKPILTASEQRWDFLHARDVARAVRVALELSHARGVYVLGSGSAPSLRSTIETIRDLIDPALPLGFGEVPYRPDQVMLLQADVTRLQHELGWRAETGLPAGLAETVEWYRANPWIFERERPE